MKTLEVRRHSLTKKGPAREQGSRLSAEGVRRAREVGETMPPFDYVVTGPDRRHIETAVAMGCAVDESIDWASGYVSGVVEHHDQWQWDQPFARYAELLAASADLRAVADEHLEHWRRALTHVPDDGAALAISSGGSIEPVLVAAAARSDWETWGTALHQLDGATLVLDGPSCIALTIRRTGIAGRIYGPPRQCSTRW